MKLLQRINDCDWINYETFSVAWHMKNDAIFEYAREHSTDYEDFIEGLKFFNVYQTPDGIKLDDPEVFITQINRRFF